MTEALQDNFYTSPEVDLVTEIEVVARPQLEVIRELMPAFVLTEDDRSWWRGLPGWRKELYLLPKASSEAERIQMINDLGMTVVSYVGGKITTYSSQG